MAKYLTKTNICLALSVILNILQQLGAVPQVGSTTPAPVTTTVQSK